MSDPYQNETIRNWFFSNKMPTHSLPKWIGTVGSNPFEETEFDNFLKEFGFEISAPSRELSVLIIGRSEWDEKALHEVIESRRGRELRVYSQEMLLSYLGSGKDPLNYPEVSTGFSEGHPALEHIIDWGFDWPNTKIVPPLQSTGTVSAKGWNDKSILKYMGYNTGVKGRNPDMRRAAIRGAFLEQLPTESASYGVRDWGTAGSGVRLQKIAERLSINVTNQSALGHHEAAQQNLDDLRWIKTEYYDGRYTFRWPSHTAI